MEGNDCFNPDPCDMTGLTLPRQFGGMNFPTTAYTAVIEMISRADASLMTLFALQGCGETIWRYGSPDLHERFLPGLCEGRFTACMALTEPHAGSALDTASTRAVTWIRPMNRVATVSWKACF